MRKIILKIKFLTNRFSRCVRNFKSYWAYGGVVKVNITQVNYGNLMAGKRILITGGSSGIGFAIAQKCISEGAIVAITGRSEEKLKVAKSQIDSPNLHTYTWDVTDVESVLVHVKNVKEVVGGEVDCLVNNAGVLLPKQDFFNVSEETWDQTYATNLKGSYFLTRTFCDQWIQAGHLAKVLNISSQGGFCAASYPYRMTKWDMVGLTKGLGKLLAPKGIIVNGIAPGMIATDMINRSSENVYSELQVNNRLGLPEEISELAFFLLSSASNNIIGQTIICDGGYTLNH